MTLALDSTRPRSVEEAVEKIREEFHSAGDLDDLSAVQRLAGLAAEAMLAVGDVPRAAHFCRAAGMVEEAHRLYTELLGAPEEGVETELAEGNPEGAANLLEIAGRSREAAAALSVAARRSPRPSRFVERVFRLDRDEGIRLLDDLLCARVPDAHNAPLFYRLGVELQASGQPQRSEKIFQSLLETVGPYADVEARLLAARADRSPPRMTAAMKRTPVTEEVRVLPPLTPQEAVGVVREAVREAARRVRASQIPPPVAPRSLAPPIRRADDDRSSVPPLLDDELVRAARNGPAVATLLTFTRGAPCDLSNIEVFYRLGVAHLAGGHWDDALAAFDAVEDVSPGYRDAGARAEALRVWRAALLRKAALTSGDVGALVQNRYVIRGELGRGGMAVVYRAEDRLLAREVALKFTAARATVGQALEEVFLAEARASAGLNHPNVVTVYDFGAHEGRVFIVMELVEGTDLARHLALNGPPPVLEALRAIVAAMEGVDYAHNRGIIHRDLKPSNLLRTAAGGVKVSDFGIAAGLSARHSDRVLGTLDYMSPEQLRGDVVDRRSDVFALGVTLFELLTGQFPFDGARRDAPAPRVGLVRAGVPQLVEGAIANALQLDPSLRYQTVGEFLAPLRHVLDGVDGLSEQLLRNGATAFEVVPTLPPLPLPRSLRDHST
ncbi:MAG: serine/threonine-protein kinase [Polyangiales bacterium]